MARQFGVVCALLVCHACNHAEASDVAEGSAETKVASGISPELDKGDKKFFGKDYPWDKRPKVDVLHFKYPYPAVKDSDDFDKDYIKDENSDNGEFRAQSEYDRLRHKLAEGKEKVAKTLREKDSAEKELQAAMRRMQAAKDIRERMEAPSPKRPGGQGGKGEAIRIRIPEIFRPEKSEPGGVASPGDVRIATTDTQRAMAALEECKKELAEAREKLKKLMEELEDAKKEQKKTQAAYEAAMASEKDSETESQKGRSTVQSEYKEYMDAREDFLKQQALVAKMEVDLKQAASKVQAIRDGADKNGGVYNSGDGKSAAHSFTQPLLVFVVLGLTTMV